MSEFIKVDIENDVQCVRIDRPDKKNALNRAMYLAMRQAFEAGEANNEVGAHLILGVPGSFSSGNDIADFVAAVGNKNMGTEIVDFLLCLSTLKKPLIAGVDGLAIGVGATIQLHCDLSIASDRSVFHTPFVDLGLVPEAASSLLAPRLMGHQRAFAFLAAGEKLSCEQALTIGLIHRQVSEHEVEQVSRSTAQTIAQRPREATAIAKSLLKNPDGSTVERIQLEAKHFAERLQSDEAKQAFMAFMARKR